MNREVTISAAWGLGITLVLGILVLVGSRNLAHFDAALVAYTASVLFATFGLIFGLLLIKPFIKLVSIPQNILNRLISSALSKMLPAKTSTGSGEDGSMVPMPVILLLIP